MTGVLLLEADVSAGEDLLTADAGLGLDAYAASRPQTALADLTGFCRKAGIRGIVPCWEFLTPLATRLAAALGLPGHLPARADACRNKRPMAEAFAAHGVPSPRALTAPDHATLSRRIAAAGLRFPLVVKPAENAASIGVSVVRSADGIPDAARLARSQTHKLPHGIALDTTLLAQEHVDGAEFSVETLVTDGTVHHLTVTEKFTTEGTSRAELGHTVPAELPPAVRDSVYAAATAALTALGLRNGIAHTELKVDPDGRPQVIEVGARPTTPHSPTLALATDFVATNPMDNEFRHTIDKDSWNQQTPHAPRTPGSYRRPTAPAIAGCASRAVSTATSSTPCWPPASSVTSVSPWTAPHSSSPRSTARTATRSTSTGRSPAAA